MRFIPALVISGIAVTSAQYLVAALPQYPIDAEAQEPIATSALSPVVTCIRAGNRRAADCTRFINTFCNDVSSAATPIRVGDSTSRCFVTPAGQSCAFTAFNSHTATHPPNNTNCKRGLAAVISRCPRGGEWVYPNHGSFTFAVDSNVAKCDSGIKI